MPTLRTYGDGCGIAHALDLVGERWALLVVRELLLGPKRFTDLRGGLPSASPNVLSLGTWAVRSPSFPEDAPVGTDSVVLALGTFFDAGAAGGLDARYELRLDDTTFHVVIADRAISLDRGPAEEPDAIVDSDAVTFAAVVWNGRDLDDALRAGELKIEGDRRAVDRLLGLFPKPAPVARASA